MFEFNQVAPFKSPSSIAENETKSNDEISIVDYLVVIWRKKIEIILIILIILIGSLIYNLLVPKTYEADMLIRIGKIKGTLIANIVDVKLLFNNDTILNEIISALNIKGLDLPRQLATMFSIETKDTEEILKIKKLLSAQNQ